MISHAARLETLEDVDALWQGAVESLSTAGIDHSIYLTVDAEFQNPFLRCTVDGIYGQVPPEEDPFLRHACETYKILTLGVEYMDGHPYINARERDFIERAGREGFRAALGIPMRLRGTDRFGGFIVGSGLDKSSFDRKILPRAEEIRLFCLLVHRRMEELTADAATMPREKPDFRALLLAPDLPEPFDVLSPREREVIYLICRGRSRQETADICDISIHTVSDYAKSGYRKLGVHNRAQAAAILLGTPDPLDGAG